MTERRPAHEPVPDFVERQIREAQARGDFDGLRGAGQPLADLDKPYDELWWVKRKLRDEQVTELPPALRARRDRDESLAAALAATDETEARRILDDVNERIREINRTTWYGPPTSVGPLDVDEVLARWRLARGDPPPGVTTDGAVGDTDVRSDRVVAGPPAVRSRGPWRRAWRRLRRRAR